MTAAVIFPNLRKFWKAAIMPPLIKYWQNRSVLCCPVCRRLKNVRKINRKIFPASVLIRRLKPQWPEKYAEGKRPSFVQAGLARGQSLCCDARPVGGRQKHQKKRDNKSFEWLIPFNNFCACFGNFGVVVMNKVFLAGLSFTDGFFRV